MKKIYLLSLMFTFFAVLGYAQSGEISGKIVDENGEGIPFANVAIVENGQPTGVGATTDFDGFYSIKPLNPGKYDVKFSYLGYTSIIKTAVVVKNDQTTYIDQPLSPSETIIEEVQIIEYKVPLIDPGETSSKNTITSEDIADLPSRNIANIASTSAGVTEDSNGEISIRGGRADAVVYYVDGIRVNGTANVPISAVGQIDVIAGGVPSRYGDATAGVVNITTKGGAKQLTGGVEFQSSLDRWRFDLVNVNVAGPLLKNAEERTVIGYSLNAEFQRQLDPRPSSVDMYKLKDEKLTELQETPLFLDEEGNVRVKAENITFDDLEVNNIKRNTADLQGRLNARLDFRLNDNMNIALGGNFSYQRFHDWVEEYSLLNYENNPLNEGLNYKAFARFTHNFKKNYEADGENLTSSPIQNGFYQVQVDYEKFKRVYSDDSHGDDLFAYGYIGQFRTEQAPTFVAIDADGDANNDYYALAGVSDTAVYFTPGTENERGANFTTQYLQLAGETDANGINYFNGGVTDIQATPALINGERAEIPYSIWYNTGRQYNGYGIDNDNDKYRVSINSGFDILKPGAESRNKHSLTFGFEFEQRVLRAYNMSPLSLWDVARQNTNTHLSLNQDELYLYNGGNPIAVDADAPDVYFGDSVFYFNEADLDAQTVFDRNLREKIGAEENEIINIYNLPLETFDIGMFSADELLENNTVSTYRGYDVYGNRTGGASFADFWNKVDEEGNKTRPIAPFSPNYSAGYIEDKFQLKDLTFRLGFRVDRYDANQKVMRDPYSIFGSVTAGDLNDPNRPENIQDDYVVYAASAEGPVLAYRDGDKFFNGEGVEVANYNSLGSIGGPLAPEEQATIFKNGVDGEGRTYDVDVAFEDYKVQYVVMPRLQFSFNITDNALFFAHYDVLSQTPQSRIRSGFFTNRSIGTPLDYYFFDENGGTPISNPNLKPETTVDFQLGFKQKVSASSAFTFSAYYKEYKNQVQVRRYDGVAGAQGGVYYSYDNIDFGNTKGFEFGYDLRRTNNIRINANYTLQFAEGTGSDDRTQLQAITASGGTNFRSVNPLNFDSRHIMNVSADYSFGEGKDYDGPVTKNGKQILSNFGVNLLGQARSGTPYTRQEAPSSERVLGNNRVTTLGYINGSRIGWNFTLDMRISKSFVVEVGKNKEDKDPKKLYFNTYLWIDNVIGTANVTSVYRYTGAADEDGFIDSPSGEVAANTAVNPQSYRDLYRASVNTPTNYGLPRRIYLGGSISF